MTNADAIAVSIKLRARHFAGFRSIESCPAASPEHLRWMLDQIG